MVRCFSAHQHQPDKTFYHPLYTQTIERGEGEGNCLNSFAGYAKFLSLGLGAFNSNGSPCVGNPHIDYYTCNRTQGYNLCPFPFEPYYDQWDKHQGGEIKIYDKNKVKGVSFVG